MKPIHHIVAVYYLLNYPSAEKAIALQELVVIHNILSCIYQFISTGNLIRMKKCYGERIKFLEMKVLVDLFLRHFMLSCCFLKLSLFSALSHGRCVFVAI